MPGDGAAMFVVVKYADNKTCIFNPDCKNNIFLHHVKSKCGVALEDVVDVSDESGAVKHLHANPEDYAKDYLHDRETLVLLRVDRVPYDEADDGIEEDVYTPLLDGLEENAEFVGQLNPKSAKRRERAKNGRKTPGTGKKNSKGERKDVKIVPPPKAPNSRGGPR